MKVVVTLELHACEVEAGRHSAKSVIGFDQDGLMAKPCQLVGHRQTHRATTNHGYAGCSLMGRRHQNGISTWLNRASR